MRWWAVAVLPYGCHFMRWQVVAVLPYVTKWHATRCLVVQKALTKAIQLDFCKFISTRSRVEELFLRKKVHWQIVVLIEDHKCMEVGQR